MSAASENGSKRRTHFPSCCSMSSIIWTAFWPSIVLSTPTVFARGKNTSGVSPARLQLRRLPLHPKQYAPKSLDRWRWGDWSGGNRKLRLSRCSHFLEGVYQRDAQTD